MSEVIPITPNWRSYSVVNANECPARVHFEGSVRECLGRALEVYPYATVKAWQAMGWRIVPTRLMEAA